MQNIDLILFAICDREGGFTDDPADRAHQARRAAGSEYDSFCTNHGVTQFTLSRQFGRQATVEEVRALTRADAAGIYRYEYFKRPRLDELPQALWELMLDMSVNHGARRAVRMLQRTLRDCESPCAVDGVLGPRSIAAAHKYFEEFGAALVNAICETRVKFYIRLAERDPTQKRFLRGWLKRAQEFLVDGECDEVVRQMAREAV